MAGALVGWKTKNDPRKERNLDGYNKNFSLKLWNVSKKLWRKKKAKTHTFSSRNLNTHMYFPYAYIILVPKPHN